MNKILQSLIKTDFIYKLLLLSNILISFILCLVIYNLSNEYIERQNEREKINSSLLDARRDIIKILIKNQKENKNLTQEEYNNILMLWERAQLGEKN